MNAFELSSGLFSHDTEVTCNRQRFALLRFGLSWKQLGTISLVDGEYTVSKESAFRDGLRLVYEEGVLCEARIHESTQRVAYFDFDGVAYKALWLSAVRVVLESGGRDTGAVELVESIPKRWRAVLQETIPALASAFFLWLVIFNRIDEDNANSS